MIKAKTTSLKSSNKNDLTSVYLKEISAAPLLTHAQEIELSQTIEKSKQVILETMFGIPLTVRTLTEWINKIERQQTDIDEIFDTDDFNEIGIDKLVKQLIIVKSYCDSYLIDKSNLDIKQKLITAFAELPLRNNSIDRIIDQLNDINCDIVTHDGMMLRNAISCGIDRLDFHDRYVGYEGFSWLSSCNEPQWKRFATTYATEINRSIDRINQHAITAGLSVSELRSNIMILRQNQKVRETAVNSIVESNLRLVVSVARKRCADNPAALLDLIQDGNIGLIKAVEKFKWRLGFRFSTYATWWIRQSINHSFSEKTRTVRIPTHVTDSVKRVDSVIRDHIQTTGSNPTDQELSKKLNISVEKTNRIREVLLTQVSIDQQEVDLPDTNSNLAYDTIVSDDITNVVGAALGTLNPREERVLRMRFGIGTLREYTLEEIGNKFKVTRERVRQIEAKALEHLMTPQCLADLQAALD